jgi:hypothetical protein
VAASARNKAALARTNAASDNCMAPDPGEANPAVEQGHVHGGGIADAAAQGELSRCGAFPDSFEGRAGVGGESHPADKWLDGREHDERGGRRFGERLPERPSLTEGAVRKLAESRIKSWSVTAGRPSRSTARPCGSEIPAFSRIAATEEFSLAPPNQRLSDDLELARRRRA